MIQGRLQNLRDRYFDFWGLVSIVSIVIIAVLLIFPLTRLVLASFMTQDGTFTSTDNFSIIETYIEFFSERFYYETLLNSFYVCILATIFSVIIGVPIAYLVSRIAIPGKIFIRVAIVLTFVSPPFIGAYAWILLLGRNGVITGW
ncbi:MAG: iron ABC transporter permease, partial [Opitutae bacterium]|nr:iron ABC transporter permease [Opitutae bacterium]